MEARYGDTAPLAQLVGNSSAQGRLERPEVPCARGAAEGTRWPPPGSWKILSSYWKMFSKGTAADGVAHTTRAMP